ncbi:MAG TPA: hypothetical protein VFJ64_03155 [Solirubrobacterales bacterium]|nr:hypothetical protein [Solirubrobacterales bacterium]
MSPEAPDQELHERGAELIRAAFERARESGLEGWMTMTPAVLKNRILDATDRTFDESKWGASSFAEFLRQFDDVVVPVPDSRPPQVMRIQSQPAAAPQDTDGDPALNIGPKRRIRKDLWEAILNYSSDLPYYWDGVRAVKVSPDEARTDMKLPTLAKHEFSQWRRDFVARESARQPATAARLATWLEKEQPLVALPRGLRTAWVIDLKTRVFTRLEDWFGSKGIAPPVDLVYEEEPEETPDSVDPLRELVLAAVQVMKREELEALQLPAAVLMRLKG